MLSAMQRPCWNGGSQLTPKVSTRKNGSRLCRRKIVAGALGDATDAVAGTALALVLGFLPWSGCSQGGFYATSVQGAHGKDCQAIYQPAAAAEARFAAALKASDQQQQQQQQQPSSPTTPLQAEASASAVLSPTTNESSLSRSSLLMGSAAAAADQASTSSSSAASPTTSVSEPMAEQQQQQQGSSLSVSEQLQQVPGAAKDLVREILREDNRQRTQELVDAAWQTLE